MTLILPFILIFISISFSSFLALSIFSSFLSQLQPSCAASARALGNKDLISNAKLNRLRATYEHYPPPTLLLHPRPNPRRRLCVVFPRKKGKPAEIRRQESESRRPSSRFLSSKLKVPSPLSPPPSFACVLDDFQKRVY